MNNVNNVKQMLNEINNTIDCCIGIGSATRTFALSSKNRIQFILAIDFNLYECFCVYFQISCYPWVLEFNGLHIGLYCERCECCGVDATRNTFTNECDTYGLGRGRFSSHDRLHTIFVVRLHSAKYELYA